MNRFIFGIKVLKSTRFFAYLLFACALVSLILMQRTELYFPAVKYGICAIVQAIIGIGAMIDRRPVVH